jgi:hypothetical protein
MRCALRDVPGGLPMVLTGNVARDAVERDEKYSG